MSGHLFALTVALLAAAIAAIATAAVALVRAQRLDVRRGAVLAALAGVAVSAGALSWSAVAPVPAHVEAVEPADGLDHPQPGRDAETFTAQLPTLAPDDADEVPDLHLEAPAADPHPDPEAAEEDPPAPEATR